MKPPFNISDKEEFIDLAKINKTILLEISEKGKNTKPQILPVPEIQLLKLHKMTMFANPTMRIKNC